MKRIFAVLAVALALICISCGDKQVTYINNIAKNCFAVGKDGSYWRYTDLTAAENERDTFMVELSGMSKYTQSCSKSNTYSEAISYKLDGEECILYSNSCLKDGTAYIKMSVPHHKPIFLECDEQNNFDCDGYEFLTEYIVDGHIYQNVHHFTISFGTYEMDYFYAENIGLVKAYSHKDQSEFCIQLVDYKIKGSKGKNS